MDINFDKNAIKNLCFKAVKEYFNEDTLEILSKIDANVAEDLKDISCDDIIIGELPILNRYDYIYTLDESSSSVFVSIIPVFVKAKSGKKILVGTYWVEKSKPNINYYETQIKAKKDELNSIKEKRKKIWSICASIAAVLVVLIVLKFRYDLIL